jgi:hypothetical protein
MDKSVTAAAGMAIVSQLGIIPVLLTFSIGYRNFILDKMARIRYLNPS